MILKKGYILYILYIVLIMVSSVYGQTKGSGTISGKVFDNATHTPIEFATVILLKMPDTTLITGTSTNKSGSFTFSGIKPGDYSLRFQYIGYRIKTINGISISSSHPNANTGNIYLEALPINLPSVVIEGERSPITYQLDKQVIDVGQIKTALSGTAADVLENVPSVNVDIDGTVSLRGSTNFQVLIDGRPSVMAAQDALQQIPASSIQNIEIITNPTAKYDATGSAGIINIVLKKNANLGLSGIMNLTGGIEDKYGGNFILQYKTPSVSYDIGVDFNRRTFPGINRQQKQFIIHDTTSFLNSDGNMKWQRILSGLRGEVDFNLTENDNLSFGGSYGGRSFHRYSDLNYKQWTNLDMLRFSYLNNTIHNHYGTYYEAVTNFSHKFDLSGNEVSAYLSYRHNSSDEASTSVASQNQNPIYGTQTTEIGPQNEIRGNIDYALPINESEKFSAGCEYFSRIYQDINKLFVLDTMANAYQFQQPYSHTNNFNRTRFAAYSMFSDRFDSLHFQIGFRTEYTYQYVAEADQNQSFSLSRWDYFPSLHLSVSFSGKTQAMASYSRRIERPDGGDLEPFYSWFDANNVHIGNPRLKPELIDSYDLGIQTAIGTVSLSSDLYYRFTHDKLQDINSVYAENVTLRTVANVGTDQSIGGELSALFNPIKHWEFNLTGNVYDYKISGTLLNQSFANESFDWNIKNENTFTVSPSTEVQFNVRYYSPSVNAQGRWGGFFTSDLAVKHDLIPKILSLSLQANDLFGTGRREYTSRGPGFYNYNYFYRRAPIIMLNLKYIFNNYKEKNRSDMGQQDNGDN